MLASSVRGAEHLNVILSEAKNLMKQDQASSG
jgi:hypothetical protein